MQPALPHLLTPINSYKYLERNYHEYIKPYSLLISLVIHSLIAIPLIKLPLKLVKAPPGNIIYIEMVTLPLFEKMSEISALPKDVKDIPDQTPLALTEKIKPAEESKLQQGSDLIETNLEPMAIKQKQSFNLASVIKVTNNKSVTNKSKITELLNKKKSPKGNNKEAATSFEDVITHWINQELSNRIKRINGVPNFNRFVISIKVDNKGKILSSNIAVSSGNPYIDNLYLSNLDQIGPPPSHLLKYFSSQEENLQFELILGAN